MIQSPVAIILAAGQGKRMKSDRAKVLHEVCGLAMIHYVVEAARGAGARTVIVVVGVGAEQVQEALADEPDVLFVTQEERRGTGHAVKICEPLLKGYAGPAMVLVGDEPLLRSEPLADLLKRQKEEGAACLLGTAKVHEPFGFGRILRDTAGEFLRIVEQRDCTHEQEKIREINPSCYVFELPRLWEALGKLSTDNAQKEEYLTDAPAILQEMGEKVKAVCVLDPHDIVGVNTRKHLADVHLIMQGRIQNRLMDEGVSIVDPSSTYIDSRAEIGADTLVMPFTVIQGRVKVGQGCRLGPFTHLRNGTVIDDGAEVGAFVETSQSHFHAGARARHLAYLGNAEVGAGANVGAGTITANYDGVNKHTTEIGANASLGAGSILIAPTRVGDGAVVGAGAVVTRGREVPPGQTVVGVPAREISKREGSRDNKK